MIISMSGDDIRNIAEIVGGDNAYRHFVKRINKEFEIADEERNTHVYVFYQKNKAGKGKETFGHKRDTGNLKLKLSTTNNVIINHSYKII